MPPNFSPDSYHRALVFAAHAHAGQLLPGSLLPYLVHLVSVAAEVLGAAMSGDVGDVDFAVTCALLHDTLEDTKTSAADVDAVFGARVLAGVQALSKNLSLPKDQQMADSLRRIAAEPREVAVVKLADRINNLESPPAYWPREKRIAYREEARRILAALGPASASLAARLADKIEAYGAYLEPS